MTVRLRTLFSVPFISLLAACANTPSNSLGELPRTPQASIQQLLEQAGNSTSEEANMLRLSAAETAYKQQNYNQAKQILGSMQLQQLKPVPQVYAGTLRAEIALAENQPKQALQALQQTGFERLAELPVEQQIRVSVVKAQALQADGQVLAAAKERIYIAPLLKSDQSAQNHEAIWSLIASLPADQLQPVPGNNELNGWLTLAGITHSNGSLDEQLAAIEAWRKQNPSHPAASHLPQALEKLSHMEQQPLTHIALLLPQQGQLANVSRALQDGFMASLYESQQNGQTPPAVSFYDSTQVRSLDDFYRQAKADGAQLVVGPLEKPLVKQLNDRQQLPLPTLALNYSDAQGEGPKQLYQFGLAAEDEAREAANRAAEEGKHSAVAMVPRGEWGDRVLAAFDQEWRAKGGILLGAERIDQPVELARQITRLLQTRQKGQSIDFIFLAATPQQARQIKPTLAYQYAGDIPVYATSHLYAGTSNPAQDQDLNGVQFCETPWLLNSNDPIRRKVVSQWSQAASSLGRLYAMGSDAYLLSTRLPQLKALPNTQINGLSGELTLSPTQRVIRKLPWAQFVNGQVQPVSQSGTL
jgi:outer membrane PBP1 activator LpoA protein